jgi:thioredoxin-dependent peroxiredoxin
MADIPRPYQFNLGHEPGRRISWRSSFRLWVNDTRAAGETDMELAIGDKAPSFKLATSGGGAISLAALKGTPFVLYFYPKDNTTGCTREAVDFSKHIKAFEKIGVTVVGVSKDSPASHDGFANKHKLKIVLASDPEADAAQRYGVWGEKKLYGRTYMGMERATFLIDAKGMIRSIWRKVKVAGHADAVLDAAKLL